MESISRISSMLETARDLTLEAARDASSARRTANKTQSPAQLRKLLDSRSEREVLEGLRKVISMTCRSQPTLPFFSNVIKNIASPSLEVKKLVYIYLLHHAEDEPDTALLSINTIQKSLSDSNPQLRALALRVMSGIRVPVISQIVSLGIKRGVGDMSPFVRRTAALAIPKCYRLDPNTLPQLLEYLSTLLGDKQYFVAGAAVSAFLEICPERIDLIHQHYRSLVRKLVDMDEWGQLATLRLMMVYARKCFPRRTRRVRKDLPKSNTAKGFYDSDSDTQEETEDNSNTEEIVILDPDLELLLKSAKPLLQSRNSAVVVAVTRCFLYLGTQAYLDTAIGPLVSLLRSASDIQHICLYNIVQVCIARPEPFVQHYAHFLVRSTDAPHIWRLKLEVLTLIFPHSPARLQSLILAELSHFCQNSGLNAALVHEAVRAIGRCASSSVASSDASTRCLRLLLEHIGSADAYLVAESLEVIRHLIQREPAEHVKTVIGLAKHLDVTTNPQARASIIWLVGEFSGIDPQNNIAADVLRILMKRFPDEAEPAKLQILLLAAKVYVHHLNLTNKDNNNQQGVSLTQKTSSHSANIDESLKDIKGPSWDDNENDGNEKSDTVKEHPIAILWRYILLLTRYDTSYDLRDRARLYRALLAVPSSTELATLVLLAPKPVPQTPSPSASRTAFTLGSASLVIGDEGGVGGLGGYESLPEWVKLGNEPDPSCREDGTLTKAEYGERKEMPAGDRLDSALGANEPGSSSMKNMNGLKEKTLDDWLAEDDESEEDDSSDEAEESAEDETEDDDEEEEDEEEEDDDDDDDEEEESSEDEGEGARLVK